MYHPGHDIVIESYCHAGLSGYFQWLDRHFKPNSHVNSEFCKQALAKVGNPNILINIVSRRVRQLTTGGGSGSRPLILDVQNLGAADIALLELVEDKMAWETPTLDKVAAGAIIPPKKRRSKNH